ncbi:hypothetical protein AAHE18_11G095600 [Arachis hypogaea]
MGEGVAEDFKREKYNLLDPEILVKISNRLNFDLARESNPACQVEVKHRTDKHPLQITVTFVNGVEQAFDATSTPAQSIRTMILEKGQTLETEQMFREAGESWPVIIPKEELSQPAPGVKWMSHLISLSHDEYSFSHRSNDEFGGFPVLHA